MNPSSLINSFIILSILLVSSVFFKTNAQISTPCTASVLTSFTPCMNFVTGGSSPSKACCDSLKTMFSDSTDCTCLIITGNVPVSIPFVNQTLAISLPRACGSSVPLQCKATGVPLPPPGPVLLGPTQAPIATAPAPAPHRHRHRHSPGPSPTLAPAAPPRHTRSPKASRAVAVAAPAPAEDIVDSSPASPPLRSPSNPSANPGIRPVVRQNSASNLFTPQLPLILMLLGYTVFM